MVEESDGDKKDTIRDIEHLLSKKTALEMVGFYLFNHIKISLLIN